MTRLLRGHWLASSHKAADQLVFCKNNEESGDYRDAGKAFPAAVKAAGLHGEGRLAAPRLRLAAHRQRAHVVFVSRQLGHSGPTITLVYAHFFEQAGHAAAAREALEGAMANTSGR